jgi:tetratricopeptide (TPR) repeat protein
MASPYLKLVLLFATCLSCASVLEPWYQTWTGGRNQTANILDMLIGDSRRLFANHFFAKADAYFHSGYYPTIFDPQDREEKLHMAEGHEQETGEKHVHDESCGHEEEAAGFLGPPKDWIDRFSRNFFPSSHSHLDKGGERELLPWLRLSAQLDPQRVDTYTIASYWLRSRLGKVDEAEQFLREGLRTNPDSYEIYFELGRIYDENRHDRKMARTLWEIALRKWNAQPEPSAEKNLVYEGIVGRLARLEEAEENLQQAIYYLKLLEANLETILNQKELEPTFQKATQERLKHIEEQIQELKTKDSARPQ